MLARSVGRLLRGWLALGYLVLAHHVDRTGTSLRGTHAYLLWT